MCSFFLLAGYVQIGVLTYRILVDRFVELIFMLQLVIKKKIEAWIKSILRFSSVLDDFSQVGHSMMIDHI